MPLLHIPRTVPSLKIFVRRTAVGGERYLRELAKHVSASECVPESVSTSKSRSVQRVPLFELKVHYGRCVCASPSLSARSIFSVMTLVASVTGTTAIGKVDCSRGRGWQDVHISARRSSKPPNFSHGFPVHDCQDNCI